MTFSSNNGFIQTITCGTINIVRACVKTSPAQGRRCFTWRSVEGRKREFRCLGFRVGHGRLWPNRLWPNRLWPELVFLWYGQLWPKPTLAKTDFGQNRLWPNRLWPKPTLAKTDFGQTSLICCVLCCVVLCVVFVAWALFHGVRVGFHVWVLVSRFGLDRPSWTAQNFALFFPSPAAKFVLFFPLWVSSRWIVVVFEAPGRSNVHVWALWLSCGTLAAPPDRAAGASHDNQRTPNAHIWASRCFKHHQNSTRKPPEREERMKFPAGESKKSAIFRASHPSGPHPLGPPPLLTPTPVGLNKCGFTPCDILVFFGRPGHWPSTMSRTMVHLFFLGQNNIVRVFWWKRRRPKAGDVFTKTRLMPVLGLGFRVQGSGFRV